MRIGCALPKRARRDPIGVVTDLGPRNARPLVRWGRVYAHLFDVAQVGALPDHHIAKDAVVLYCAVANGLARSAAKVYAAGDVEGVPLAIVAWVAEPAA